MTSLIEKLAELEHEQWCHWIKYQEKYVSPTTTKAQYYYDHWERCLRLAKTPYSELTEDEKESDREWARKVLAVFEDVRRKEMKEQVVRLGQMRAGNIDLLWDAGWAYGLLKQLGIAPEFKTREEAFKWAKANICRFLKAKDSKNALLVGEKE